MSSHRPHEWDDVSGDAVERVGTMDVLSELAESLPKHQEEIEPTKVSNSSRHVELRRALSDLKDVTKFLERGERDLRSGKVSGYEDLRIACGILNRILDREKYGFMPDREDT